MNETQAREHIDKHAKAVVDGDMDALAADFSEELRPQLPQLAKNLPQPVTAADVLNVDAEPDEAVALIRYSGGGGELTIRSRWREEGGRPVIVQAEPAG